MDPERAEIEDGHEEQTMLQDDQRPGLAGGCETCHRKLAVASIICGCTPIGVVSLINSVMARETCNTEKSEQYSRKAKKYGILSIVVWVTFLIMLPVLVVLGSYLLTLIE